MRGARVTLTLSAIVAFLSVFVLGAQVAQAAMPIDPPTVHGCTERPVDKCMTDPAVTGLKFTAYTGTYYRPVDEEYRKCIAQREGRFQYWVTGSNGYYFGTYQFTAALARGAAWEMTPELKAAYPDRWKLIRNILLDTPMNRWSRFYADMAWWTILNVDGEREGAPHWAGGRFRCYPGMSDWGGIR